MESVVHMYILQHGHMQKYFNIHDDQPDQLQHKTYKYEGCPESIRPFLISQEPVT